MKAEHIKDHLIDWPIVIYLAENVEMPFGKHQGKPIGVTPIYYLDSQVIKWERNCFSRQAEFVLDFIWKNLAIYGASLDCTASGTVYEALFCLQDIIEGKLT